MKNTNNKPYGHLSLEERIEIYRLRKEGWKISRIAEEIGRDKATVCRELTRNKSRCDIPYSPLKAHENSLKRAVSQRTKAPLKNPETFFYVREKLRNENWSPEIISGRITIDKPGLAICPETIYQYIFGKGKRYQLWKFLPEHHRKRRVKSGRHVQQCKSQSRIPGAVSIDLRPKRAGNRSQIGHIETDLMEGKKSQKAALSVAVDRKSRHTSLGKVKNKTAEEKQKVLTSQLKPLQSLQKANYPIVRSITADNGTENSNHKQTSSELGIKYYFCHPYHSWEKGTVENTIKRIRRYIPKGMSISGLKKHQIQWVENKINSTPMKVLNFQTPNEVMEKEANRYKFRKYKLLKEAICCTST
jgi:IS30 family transposase